MVADTCPAELPCPTCGKRGFACDCVWETLDVGPVANAKADVLSGPPVFRQPVCACCGVPLPLGSEARYCFQCDGEGPTMEFRLTIELGNEAMRTGEDVAQALRDVADRIGTLWGYSDMDPIGPAPVMDENGNRVGSAEVIGE